MNYESTAGEIDVEWYYFRVGQLNRRTWRLIGLVVAFIAGSIVFYYHSLCLRVLGSDFYNTIYGFPSNIDVVIFVAIFGIGLALYCEWLIIRDERYALHSEWAFIQNGQNL